MFGHTTPRSSLGFGAGSSPPLSSSNSLSKMEKSLLESINEIEEITEARKKSVGDAMKYFHGKMDVVKMFGKKLQALADSTKIGSRGEIEGGCIQKGVEVVKEMDLHLGMMYTAMEAEMREKVINPIEAEKERTDNITKNALGEMYKIEKDQRESLSKVQKSQTKYFKCREDNFELEKAIETEDFGNGDEDDLRAQMSMKQREIIEARELYMANVKASRTLKIHGDRKIGRFIDAMQTLEKERINALIKVIKNYVDVQLRTYRLLVEEVEAASRVLIDDVKFSSEKELKRSSALLHGTLAGQSLPKFEEWTPAEKQSWFEKLLPRSKNKFNHNPEEEKTSTNDNEDEQGSRLRNDWGIWFDHQFECIGNRKTCTCTTSPVSGQDLFASLLNRKGRRDFSQMLATHRSHNSGIVDNKESLENIVQAMLTCLDSADKEVAMMPSLKTPRTTARDVASVKEVMIVSQTLYHCETGSESLTVGVGSVGTPSSSALSESNVFTRSVSTSLGKKEFLAKYLRHHPIWKDESLWDEMLFEAVHNEKMNQRLYEIEPWFADEETAAMIANNSNVIFGQLANISHSMILFGNDIDRTKNFVEKSAKLHDLPDEFKTQILLTLLDTHSTEGYPSSHSERKTIDQKDDPSVNAPFGKASSSSIGSTSPGTIIDFLTSPTADLPDDQDKLQHDLSRLEDEDIPHSRISTALCEKIQNDPNLLDETVISRGSTLVSESKTSNDKTNEETSEKPRLAGLISAYASKSTPFMKSAKVQDEEKEPRMKKIHSIKSVNSDTDDADAQPRHSRKKSTESASILRQTLSPQHADMERNIGKKTRLQTDEKRRI